MSNISVAFTESRITRKVAKNLSKDKNIIFNEFFCKCTDDLLVFNSVCTRETFCTVENST